MRYYFKLLDEIDSFESLFKQYRKDVKRGIVPSSFDFEIEKEREFSRLYSEAKYDRKELSFLFPEKIEEVKSELHVYMFKYKSAHNIVMARVFMLLMLTYKFNTKLVDYDKTVFEDIETFKLFKYLVDNWEYKFDLKYSYIYNFIQGKELGTIKSVSKYESYVRNKYAFTNKFQYEHANSVKNYEELERLYELYKYN